MAETEHGAAAHRGDRPLSPHLQVYRPQINSATSIFHRVSGIGNSIGAVLVAWWFIAAASGSDGFGFIDGLLTSWVGHLLLIGFAFSIAYHLCNGVRHLIWDAGYGISREQITPSAYVVLGAAALLGLGLLIFGWTTG